MTNIKDTIQSTYNRINFEFSKLNIATLIILILSIVSVSYLPIDFYQENGHAEILQSILMVISMFWCFKAYKEKISNYQFFVIIGFILLLSLGREFSWGRTFAIDEFGIIPKRRDWFLGSYIYYIISPIYLFIIYYSIKTNIFKRVYNLIKYAPLRFFDFLFVVSIIIITIIFEHHGHILLSDSLYPMHFAFEEATEVALYFSILTIIVNYIKKEQL